MFEVASCLDSGFALFGSSAAQGTLGSSQEGGILGGGTKPGSLNPGVNNKAIAARLAQLTAQDRMKLKIRCAEISSNATSYDSSLVALCKLLRGS